MKPAPANQPTSNIEFQLFHARGKQEEWDKERIELERRLESARRQSDFWRESIEILEFQLALRRKEDL